MSLDGMPYIGQYSTGTPNLYVATGFNKWGMTGSMVAAQLLCDLVRGKENPYEALFSPSRSMLHPQEHSWDCPCHGSRFTEDGKLLDNPATGDLKKRD